MHITTQKDKEQDEAMRREKKKLDEEITCWSSQRLRILRMLFTAAVGANSSGLPSEGTSCREYYIRIDQSPTELFFGQEFDFLLNYSRKNRTSSRISIDIYTSREAHCKGSPQSGGKNHTSGSRAGGSELDWNVMTHRCRCKKEACDAETMPQTA